MRLDALAVDYDRTLTPPDDIHPVPAALDALARARRAGVRVVVVSGRALGFLEARLGHLADAIVAENGAILRGPDGRVRQLAAPLALGDAGIALERGTVIASAAVEDEARLRAALDRAGVEADLVRNRDRVMALPRGVSKASGVLAALEALGVDASRVVALGDGENDAVLFQAVGRGVAVANAAPELLRVADEVTRAPGGDGVAEWLLAHVEVAA